MTDEQVQSWTGRSYGANPLPTLAGPCPHCRHQCEIRVRNRVARGAAVAADDGSRGLEAVSRQFRCNCLEEHDRPEGVTEGCGRWWIAEVVGKDGAWAVRPQYDPTLVRATVALAASEAGEAARVRAAAEKWVAAVAALLGLFSLTGVVTAKDALAGVARGDRMLVGSGLALTTVLAAVSLVLAYTAAYGWPGTDDVGDDTSVAAWFRRRQDEPLEQMRLLRWAVLLALVTLVVLLIVVMLLWFLPRAASVPAVTG